MPKNVVKEEQRDSNYTTQFSYIHKHIKCEWTRLTYSKGRDCETEYNSK